MSSSDLYLMLLDFICELKSFSILMAILLGIVFLWTGWVMFNLWLEELWKS